MIIELFKTFIARPPAPPKIKKADKPPLNHAELKYWCELMSIDRRDLPEYLARKFHSYDVLIAERNKS